MMIYVQNSEPIDDVVFILDSTLLYCYPLLRLRLQQISVKIKQIPDLIRIAEYLAHGTIHSLKIQETSPSPNVIIETIVIRQTPQGWSP